MPHPVSEVGVITMGLGLMELGISFRGVVVVAEMIKLARGKKRWIEVSNKDGSNITTSIVIFQYLDIM